LSWCLLLFLDASDVRAVRARVGAGGMGGARVVEWHRTRASGACSTEQAPGAGSSVGRGPTGGRAAWVGRESFEWRRT
jgi:hypothetical protein